MSCSYTLIHFFGHINTRVVPYSYKTCMSESCYHETNDETLQGDYKNTQKNQPWHPPNLTANIILFRARSLGWTHADTTSHVSARKRSFQDNCGFRQGQIWGQHFAHLREHKRPILRLSLCLAIAWSSVNSKIKSNQNKKWKGVGVCVLHHIWTTDDRANVSHFCYAQRDHCQKGCIRGLALLSSPQHHMAPLRTCQSGFCCPCLPLCFVVLAFSACWEDLSSHPLRS